MYIQYVDDTGATVQNHELSNLSLTSSVDVAMNTLPVDEFTVDVITDYELKPHEPVKLYDDKDRLFASFVVNDTQRKDKHILTVNAMSPLGFLDKWTEPAKRITRDIRDLCRDMLGSAHMTVQGVSIEIPYTVVGTHKKVNGFAPEQIARDRFLWACMAACKYVQQSFCEGLRLIDAPDFSGGYTQDGALIPYEKIFLKPTVKRRKHIAILNVEQPINMNTSQSESKDHSGTDASGNTWYWAVKTLTFEDMNNIGDIVTISGNSLMYGSTASAKRFAMLYMLPLEIKADIYGDVWNYLPGTEVRIYADEDTVYDGVIQSADYSFGQQARARLTIMADSRLVEMQQLSFIHRYFESANEYRTLGRHDYRYPTGYEYVVKHPKYILDVVNEQMALVPITEKSSGQADSDTSTVIQYVRRGSGYLLEKWDLTQSFIGELHGEEIAAINGTTISAEGVALDTISKKLYVYTDRKEITIEIDVASMNITYEFGYNFISVGSGYLRYYGSQNRWEFYDGDNVQLFFNIYSEGVFENSTVKIVIDEEGKWHIYKNGALLWETRLTLIPNNRIDIGGSQYSSSTTENDLTITGIRLML